MGARQSSRNFDHDMYYQTLDGGSKDIKLISVKKSTKAGKKYTATFEVNGRVKHTDFGDSSMEDYTQHKDPERKRRYQARHAKDLSTNDPTRAGYLSYYILWGPSTSIQSNVKSFKQKFNL